VTRKAIIIPWWAGTIKELFAFTDFQTATLIFSTSAFPITGAPEVDGGSVFVSFHLFFLEGFLGDQVIDHGF